MSGGFPTDPEREESLGRIPFWLDVEHIQWIADHCLCGRVDHWAPHTIECRYIRMRAEAALHKLRQSGVD